MPKSSYGPGFLRMKNRLGPKKMEDLRQAVLREQEAARQALGGSITKRDRETYKDYPMSKPGKK